VGRVAGGLVEVVVGAVALSAGAGIAVPHLTRAGLSATGAWATLAVLAGLALLASGTRRLSEPLRWWGRLPTAVAVVAGAAVLLLTLGPAVAATTVPRTLLAPTTPADRGLTFEEVTFATDDGVALSGWYLPSTNGAAVALLHGAGSTRTSVLDEAVVLARHGYGVLLFDARGHGRSEGRAMAYGWNGDADTMAAVTFLTGRPDVQADRIGVVGLSMGGEQAIGALAADPRIRAAVAEGATGRTAADNAWFSEVYERRGSAQEMIDRLRFTFVDLLTEAPRPPSLRESAAAAAPRPILLIAAGEVPDEQHAAAYIRSGSPASVEVWVVAGARHTGGLATAPSEWRTRVTAFLDGALPPPA